MPITSRNHIRSKWAKTRAIWLDHTVRPYISDTRWFDREAFRRMLARYDMVYVKPVSGTFGNGVMRIARTPGGGFISRWKRDKRLFRSFSSLYEWIRLRIRGRPYLIQKGIRLLTYRGRLFDIRVMVQKNPRRMFETTGIIGRLAHPTHIVTNYHSGGRPTDVRTLLKPHVGESRIPVLTKRMSAISLRAAIALQRVYAGVNMVGADIGLDASLKPWIIELNTNPDPYLFRFLKDKRVSRKVLRYARALRRVP